MKNLLILFGLFLISEFVYGQCTEGDDCGQFGMPECKDQPEDPDCPECIDCPEGSQVMEDENGDIICIPVRRPVDPNDITGPTGYGDARWIAASEPMKYTIRFENDPELATASARNVSIDYTFSDKVNQSSLVLSNHGFNYFVYDIPGERPYYDTELDVSDSLGVLVALTAGVDVQRNQAFWRYRSLDPETRQEVRDVLLGFLPVNDSTGSGEGFVEFFVTPKVGLETGDTIFAQANIIFDDNGAILTNRYSNVIDADEPISAIDSVNVLNDSTFAVYTSGSDESSGLQKYDLFMSQNDGSYQLIGTSLQSDSAFIVTGMPDSTYCFITLATDNVGNKEDNNKIKNNDVCKVLTTKPTGTDPPIADIQVIIFPNPTPGLFTLRFDSIPSEQISIRLINTAGQIVYDKNHVLKGTNDIEIDIQNLIEGEYVLHVISESLNVSKRIIKF